MVNTGQFTIKCKATVIIDSSKTANSPSLWQDSTQNVKHALTSEVTSKIITRRCECDRIKCKAILAIRAIHQLPHDFAGQDMLKTVVHNQSAQKFNVNTFLGPVTLLGGGATRGIGNSHTGQATVITTKMTYNRYSIETTCMLRCCIFTRQAAQ